MIGLTNLDSGVNLFTLAFSVTQWEQEPREIFIGGLQGNKSANDKELIVAMTRGWHGLRPKALLLFALQSLVGLWGITRLRAVSDATHIYRHWRKLETGGVQLRHMVDGIRRPTGGRWHV